MKEFMASSGVLVVEIAVVLIVIVSAFGIYLLRRKKGTETEAKSFVKKINANVAQRKESRTQFAKDTFGEHLDESEISAHVDSLLEKENSLYSKFIKVVMKHEGHAIDQINQYVDDLVKACHIDLLSSTSATSEASDKTEVHAELIQSLRNDNEDMRYEIEKLKAENEKITAEYEIIYEKYEALTKQQRAAS